MEIEYIYFRVRFILRRFTKVPLRSEISQVETDIVIAVHRLSYFPSIFPYIVDVRIELRLMIDLNRRMLRISIDRN